MATKTNARRIQLSLEMQGFVLRRSEFEAMGESLGPLESAVTDWFSENRSANGPSVIPLNVTAAYRPRSDEYHVRTRLCLPQNLLMTGEHDAIVLPAYERCLRKLVHKLAWRDHIDSACRGCSPDRSCEEMLTTLDLEASLQRAHKSQDSIAFRNVLESYTGLVRERVGRWVRRYSSAASAEIAADAMRNQSSSDEPGQLGDLVEEVMLTALERYPGKPLTMRIDDWLVGLIDPAMRSYLTHPAEELDAIGFARTLREMGEQSRCVEPIDEEFDKDARNAQADLFRRSQ